MIRILRIINRFNIGGPTYNATFLTRYMSDEFETMLVGGLPEEGEADSLYILEEHGVKPILIPEMKRQPNFNSDRAAYLKIKQIIQEFKPHIVHTHAAKAGAIGRKAAKDCGVPIIIHTFHGHVFHSYFGKIKTWIYKMVERNLAKKSTGIIAISDLQKKELSEDFSICKKDKIKVIPLGFDLLRFQNNLANKRALTRSKYQISDNEVAIAIVGRLAPIKNHDFFLDVIEGVLNRQLNQKFRVFIVGDGETKSQIEARINSIHEHFQTNVIEMTSWIKDIPTFNAGMDMICLTSKNEGTPVSLIEAQASGVPVITTNVGGVKDIIAQNETGFVVESVDEFIDKVCYLIENEKKRQEMSQNGWSFVKEKFHYTRLVKDMENYYKELIENKGVKC